MRTGSWKFDFSRVLNPAESIDLLEIKHELRNVQLMQEEDELVGDCTTEGIYLKIAEDGTDWEFYRVVHSKFVPPKVMFIIWASMHDSIPTRSMLQARRVEINSNLCLLCNNEVETQGHLFIDCSWVKYFWEIFINSMQVSCIRPLNFKETMLSWRVERVSPRIKLVWHLLPYAICWELWLERNRRNHGGRPNNKDELVYAIKLDIFLWSSTTEIFKDFTMNQIIHH
ncbi:uncharacterized protein LOC113311825 [Papaver somniferum]|uniref:uncharacterized protein LOC113311825 n=1 Tax=Papaver somniferum TaxID=3469 RepID=UPI000E6F6222|nr:uncharacterized protein LOC113311825 [Papaver somniferum]